MGMVGFTVALMVIGVIISPCVHGNEFSDHKEIEVERLLKRLNKHALISIKSEDGDIIDCVPIHNQPAFDHPLLRNHTIQMRPSFIPESTSTYTKKKIKATQAWHKNGRCPKNTVPIRRIKKEDILRSKSIESFGRKTNPSIPEDNTYDPSRGHEYAVMNSMQGTYFGTKCTVNMWKPEVQVPDEFSLAQTWLVSGVGTTRNTIEAGLQVFPRIYGDNNLRLFVYWTADGYQSTGCYNNACPGFVQRSNRLTVGVAFTTVSQYDGDQYELSILIWKSPDGDIIDCVWIYDQPAFDHPLFKNHTIQRRPRSNSIRDKTGGNKTYIIHQLWRTKGECPENTIPIRRTTRDDLIRSGSIKNYGRKSPPPTIYHTEGAQTEEVHEHTCVYVDYGQFHGSKSRISIWKPNVLRTREFSLAQTWVVNGDWDTGLNTLESGWQILHALYGDKNPRLFAYWTGDTYRETGCYNLDCPGFVQVSRHISLGAALNTFSTYNGEQYDFLLTIEKDQETGLWWLKFETYLIGYWPSFIVPKLAASARKIAWGGEIVYYTSGRGTHTLTQMGSGHFAEKGFRKAAYFNSLEYIDTSNYPITPSPQNLEATVTRPECYNLQVGSSQRWGTYFFYGGPGRNPHCP
ncbi:unnamed protein product [Brassica rapa]|uniref:Neprosin PEP catalytic domain-containing protein n=1 Tax=Brassica campestris TaxID=3711 RepID=A0A8D9DAW3_BRACM|nr:unnamed protein product [Brassica rapa]